MSIAEPVAPMPERNSAEMLSTDASIGRSALKKASWRLIPLIGVAYGVAYTDRVNISFAALQMNRDLHFSASIYGFGSGNCKSSFRRASGSLRGTSLRVP